MMFTLKESRAIDMIFRHAGEPRVIFGWPNGYDVTSSYVPFTRWRRQVCKILRSKCFINVLLISKGYLECYMRM